MHGAHDAADRTGGHDVSGFIPASSHGITPPRECMASTGPAYDPADRKLSSKRPMKRAMIGPNEAFIAVVAVRSYSPNSGETSLESVTKIPGNLFSTKSLTARSWLEFMNDQRKQTANDSIPCCTRRAAALSTS